MEMKTKSSTGFSVCDVYGGHSQQTTLKAPNPKKKLPG